jgi:hypothetical protein
MKKALLLTICAIPVLLLATLYALLLGSDTMVWDRVGRYMLITAVIISLLMPVVCFGLGLILKNHFPLKVYFTASCLSSLTFWAVCYADVGDKIQQFYAA